MFIILRWIIIFGGMLFFPCLIYILLRKLRVARLTFSITASTYFALYLSLATLFTANFQKNQLLVVSLSVFIVNLIVGILTIYFVLKKLLSKLLFYSYWKILDSTGIVDNISFCQLSGRSENSAGII